MAGQTTVLVNVTENRDTPRVSSPGELVSAIERALSQLPSSFDELCRRDDALPSLPMDARARWLLVGLLRHLERQEWAGRVVQEQLHGDRNAIGRWGYLGHPANTPRAGQVVNLPGWTYEFHGKGCCLTNEDGTSIDVDFIDGGCEWIDPWFYGSYLESLRAPGLVESCLPQPPFGDAVRFDLETLKAAQLVDGQHAVRLTSSGRAWANALAMGVAAMERLGDPVARAWVALTMQDPVLACLMLGGNEGPKIRGLAARAIEQRVESLRRALHTRPSRAAVIALGELGRTHAEASVLALAATGPLDETGSAVLDLLALWKDGSHVPALLGLADRAGGAERQARHIRVRSCELVMRQLGPNLERGVRASLIGALDSDSWASDGIAGLLLSLLDLDRGVRKLTEGLTSSVPMARAESAAALALLGTPDALAALRGRGIGDDDGEDHVAEEFAGLVRQWLSH